MFSHFLSPWLAFIALLSGMASAAMAEPPKPPSPLPLGWCLEQAARDNPLIDAQEADVLAARARVLPAGALEDPRLRYEASNIPKGDLDFDSTPLSGHQFGLAQKLPFPGLLGSRADAARAGARAAESALADRRLRVGAAVEGAWAELGFAQRALEVTAANLELLRQLTRVAETKYAVGTGLQQDVLRAQVELTRLLDESLQREAASVRAEAHLAALLDLPPELALPKTDALEEDASLPELATLLTDLEETSPRLRALRERVEKAEREQRAAELEGYPDFDLGVGYRLRERVRGDAVGGDDFLSAAVTVRLPLNRSKWRARVAEREALWRRARSEYRAARAGLRGGIRTRFAELRRSDAELALLRNGLVPQARQSLESNRSGYEVDKVDFLSLIDSQVRLFEAELQMIRASADRRTAFSALEAELGATLR